MLVNLGIPWVIVGHSERRLLLGESNEVTFQGQNYMMYESLIVTTIYHVYVRTGIADLL